MYLYKEQINAESGFPRLKRLRLCQRKIIIALYVGLGL
jgi:hypothetical protein